MLEFRYLRKFIWEVDSVLINALIVDDDPICIDALNACLESFPMIKVVGEANNGEKALSLIEEEQIQLLFLDIEMEGMDGLELAHRVETLYPHIMVIFITGHPGFALEGYEVHPVDFLTKPVNINRLEKALKKVREILSLDKKPAQQKVGLHVAGGIRMINVDDILYIEKKGRTITVVCKNGEKFISKDSMKNLESVFQPFDFYRSHQSFLVPIHKIKSINPDVFSRSYTILLQDEKSLLPLSRGNYHELKVLLTKIVSGAVIN